MRPRKDTAVRYRLDTFSGLIVASAAGTRSRAKARRDRVMAAPAPRSVAAKQVLRNARRSKDVISRRLERELNWMLVKLSLADVVTVTRIDRWSLFTRFFTAAVHLSFRLTP